MLYYRFMVWIRFLIIIIILYWLIFHSPLNTPNNSFHDSRRMKSCWEVWMKMYVLLNEFSILFAKWWWGFLFSKIISTFEYFPTNGSKEKDLQPKLEPPSELMEEITTRNF
jgi:hypothetical protein